MADELEGTEATETLEVGGGGGLFDTVKKYLPLIAGVLVVQVLIGYVLVKWVLGPSSPPPEEHAAKVEKPAEASEHQPRPAKKKERSKKKEDGLAAADEVAIIYDKLDPITINTADPGGAHYVQIQINLGVAEIENIKHEEVQRLLESRKGKMLDTIIRLTTSRTMEELNTQEGRDKLKEEIRKQFNLFLNDEHEIVKEVYFATFTTQ